MMLMKKISAWILKLLGWNIDPKHPTAPKGVIVVGPHTSNWDFIIGRLAMRSYGLKTKVLIKKEAFFPPLGWLLKAIGGIPIDRKSNNNFTQQAVEIIKSYPEVYFIFTPEGTRSYNPKWKKGFYYIAKEAGVPIFIAYIDYERKIGGFIDEINPGGNVDKDIAHIKSLLAPFKGKYPEQGIRKVEDE